jgi:hypothetical protein
MFGVHWHPSVPARIMAAGGGEIRVLKIENSRSDFSWCGD